tara:strand:+ start:40058 stop:40414 length:357 start_codon:yes stop_codon:yes gene_type:complete
MAVEHRNIPEEELHELKGASTAASGQVPFANGSGTTEFRLIFWADVNGKPTFAEVAESGSYTDLTDTPTIPTDSDIITVMASKTQIAALNAIADTSTATAEEIAVKVNQIISALKAGV